MVLVVKNPPGRAGGVRGTVSVPGSGRPPAQEMATRHSCLEKALARGAWRATVHRVTESRTTERLSKHTGAQSLYNTVLTPSAQRSDPVTHIHVRPLFWLSFLFRPS